jgi:hypothetical protein
MFDTRGRVLRMVRTCCLSGPAYVSMTIDFQLLLMRQAAISFINLGFSLVEVIRIVWVSVSGPSIVFVLSFLCVGRVRKCPASLRGFNVQRPLQAPTYVS